MQWFRWLVVSVCFSAPVTPDRRGQVRPDRHFDITEMDLSIVLDPNAGALSGEVTYRFERLSPGPMVLDQVRLDIVAVTAGSQALPWWFEGDTLRIDVPDETRALSIAYSATPRAGVFFRGVGPNSPDTYPEVWTQGQESDHRHWIPLPDHPDERFRVQLDVQAPDGWKVLTNSGLEMPGYLIMFAAAPYEVVTHPDDETISVWLPPGTDRDALKRVLDPVTEMMAHFEARTGVDYVWGSYRQVFVQRFLYGGMENTSATIQNMSLLSDDRVEQTSGGWYLEVVAHELAHQWYGDLLTCRDWRELWLNEGFAEFFAGDWLAKAEGEARWAERVDEWMTDGRSGALAGRFHQGDDPRVHGSVYSKGAAVLQMLRVMLGEDRFWAAIRRYTQKHQHRSVITEDLQREMEAVSGYNLEWFFQQWVELPYIPKLSVNHAFDEGALTITVRQKVGEDRPRYTLWVEIEVGAADGEIIVHRGWMDQDQLMVTIPLEAPPRYVAFDPRGGVLAEVEQSQMPEAWEAQLSSPSAYARRVAMRNLGETDSAEGLAAALADPERPPLERQAAAGALGQQRAEGPLISALSDAHAGVRRMAAEGLAQGIDPIARRALEQSARRDPDPNVRRAAMESLQGRDPGVALRLARAAVTPRSMEEEWLARTAAEIIAAAGDIGDVRRLLRPQPGRVWPAHIRAAGRLVDGLPDGAAKERVARQTARQIEAWLQEGDIHVRQAAASALGRIGDPGSEGPLEVLRRAETVGRVRYAADVSLRRIRSGKPPKAAENAVMARIEALEERLEAAEAELDALSERR
ncbi:MAG: M1 family aminopeptidase [Myxococcota bacterium]